MISCTILDEIEIIINIQKTGAKLKIFNQLTLVHVYYQN